MRRFLLVALVALSLLFGAPLAPVALAATTCTTNLSDTTIVGDLVIPAGQTCNLLSVTITGHVRGDPGSTFVTNDTTVNGRFTGSGAALFNSTVKGSLTLSGGGVNLSNITVGGAANFTNLPTDIGVEHSRFGSHLTV